METRGEDKTAPSALIADHWAGSEIVVGFWNARRCSFTDLLWTFYSIRYDLTDTPLTQ